MLAVRDRRTGKFLKTFSGSFNNFEWRTRYKLTVTRRIPANPAEGRPFDRYENTHTPSRDEIHDAMFCLASPDGAKLYVNRGGVQTSIGGGYRSIVDPATGYKRYESIPLEEGKPWLELVDVQTFERRRAAARKGAATRRKAKRRKVARAA